MKSQELPLITDVPHLAGQRVLVRASLNVPLKDGVVANYFRIMRAMPTLKHLTSEGARVVLIAHIGRDPHRTLAPLFAVLKEHLAVTYIPHLLGREVDEALQELREGEVLLLENVRSHEGEVTGDPAFGAKLASYADVYVNDAFAVSHREHASIVEIPKHIPGYAGCTFYEEYLRLKKIMDPVDPSLFILGGSKFVTKQPLVEKYIKKYDHVFVGGALANDFFAAQGHEVGDSLVSDAKLTESPLLNSDNLLLPVDVTVESERGIRITTPNNVAKGEKIFDAGPKTTTLLKKHIEAAKTILWNGPLGNYEDGFVDSTNECAKLVANAEAYSVLGGGDTIAAIESLALNDRFGFVSTAGGAMLSFLEMGTLPGIEALKESRHVRS